MSAADVMMKLLRLQAPVRIRWQPDNPNRFQLAYRARRERDTAMQAVSLSGIIDDRAETLSAILQSLVDHRQVIAK